MGWGLFQRLKTTGHVCDVPCFAFWAGGTYPNTQLDVSQPVSDYLLTSQEWVVSHSPMQPATFTLRRVLSGKTLKAWRKTHHLTAHQLAMELGVSRSYIKSIEGGSLAASQKLIRKFEELRAQKGECITAQPEAKPVSIIARFELPASFEILAKPRRCKGCLKYFIPITPNQRTHNTAACQRTARRRKEKAK